MSKTYRIGSLDAEVRKDWYTGLWNIYYVDGGGKWAGPFKTKREAVERAEEAEEVK